MNNKTIVVIATVIAIMVSIIAFIQLLPFIEQYQRDLEEKESMKKYKECIDEAKAEAGPDERYNETKFWECQMGRYDT